MVWVWRALLLLVTVVVSAVLVSYALPRRPPVERTIDIAAPPAAIYAIVSDLRRFNDWSPWFDLDPKATYTFTGASDGVGQTMNWQSSNPKVGNGSVTITGLTPDSEVDLALDLGTSTGDSSVKIAPQGAGSRVTWSVRIDTGFNPVTRYMGLTFDRVFGPDYLRGLAKLKALAEKPAA